MFVDNYTEAILQVLHAGKPLPEGMRDLLAAYEGRAPSPLWAKAGALDFAADAEVQRGWLAATLTTEPPGRKVNGFWFGIFEANIDNADTFLLYLSGSTEFDPEDEEGEWISEPEYWPENRYTQSAVLSAFYRMIPDEERSGPEHAILALCEGYAVLLVQELCRATDPQLLLGNAKQRGVATGFDEGALLLVGWIDGKGWHRY